LNRRIEKSSILTFPFPFISAGGSESPPAVPHQKINIEKSIRFTKPSRLRSEGVVGEPSTPRNSCNEELKLLSVVKEPEPLITRAFAIYSAEGIPAVSKSTFQKPPPSEVVVSVLIPSPINISTFELGIVCPANLMISPGLIVASDTAIVGGISTHASVVIAPCVTSKVVL